MKTTAIDFLIDNFHYYYSTKWNNILEQAKEIEKQQIIDFAYYFRHEEVTKKEIEQYYNKTYENKENI